jgi:hypothetical protein
MDVGTASENQFLHLIAPELYELEFEPQRLVSDLKTESPCTSEDELFMEDHGCCSKECQHATKISDSPKTKTFKEILNTLPFQFRGRKIVYQCPHCFNYYAENGMYSQFVFHF